MKERRGTRQVEDGELKGVGGRSSPETIWVKVGQGDKWSGKGKGG